MTGTQLSQFGRMLIVAGIALIAIGALAILAKQLRIGQLPGDFTWSGRNWQVAIPLGTSILLSLILTLVLNLLLRRR